jgi:predicted permease
MRWGRKRRERDLERELQADLELEAEELRDGGLNAEEARLAARRALGNAALLKEDVRAAWGWMFLDHLKRDVVYALRGMRRSPGFTGAAVLSLALGIGANTGLFTIADALLLKALPVERPGELRSLAWIRRGGADPVGMTSHSGHGSADERGRPVDGSFSYPAYQLFRRSVPQLSDLVAFAPNQFTVTSAGKADLAFGHYVSGNYFTGLGARQLLGRPILPEDDAPGRPGVAVLSHEYWSGHFGADAGVLNRVLLLNRRPVTVVGVMPPAFQGLLPGRAVDLFVPMSMVPETSPPYYRLDDPNYWWVAIFGRLRPGASEEAAAAAVQSALSYQIEAYTGKPPTPESRTEIAMEPGSRGVGALRNNTRQAIAILAGVCGLVLLIACLNLANLLLARYAARGREIATRVSIGASRGRLMRQMLVESLVLAAVSGAAGLAVAKPLMTLLLHFLAGTMTLGIDARLDARALGFTFGIAMLAGVVFGTVPAWRAVQIQAAQGLKEAAAPGRGPRLLLRRHLVSIQIALSLLLLVGTGLFVRTLTSLAAVPLGFQTDNILTFQTDPGRTGYTAAEAAALYRRIEERILAIPGVEATGVAQLPLIGGVVTNGPVWLPGDAQAKPTHFLTCSDSFLGAMRIPILSGRDLSRADFDLPARSAVVNETFVRKYLVGRNPIGQVFERRNRERRSGPELFTIVGVARDAHYRGVRDQVPATAYLPYPFRSAGDSRMVFAVRVRSGPGAFASAVREAVASVDSNLPVAEMRTEREQIDQSLGAERLFASLMSAFGAMAMILAAIGLYGVMAFAVTRRTPEIGIRIALGAQRGEVQRMVLRQSLAMALWGIAAGVPGALALARLVRSMLYGVEPGDPASVAGAVIVIAAVAGLAAWIPARRAARVDPMRALRNE